MAITFKNGRQSPLVAEGAFAFGDLTSGTGASFIKLPYNSVVLGGYIIVDTVWNSATSDVVDLGDTTDPDRYTTSAVDLTALGLTALTLTGFINTGGLDFDAEWTGVSTAPTTGAARVYVEYMITDRATEVQTT